MNRRSTAFALSALCLSASLAHAQTDEPPQTTPRPPARETLETRYPGVTFGTPAPTPWRGVFEVRMGPRTVYTDPTGRYFLFGHLVDLTAQRDLTEERERASHRIEFTTLPLADAFRTVRGDGSRVIAVFSDPDCPFCKRLEVELAKVTNLTVHTFLFPIASLHPKARERAIRVWCARDRSMAWQILMATDTPPKARTCAHPVDRNIALANRLRIDGTPTLIATDGRVLQGAANAAQIEAWLERTVASAHTDVRKELRP